MTIPVKPVRSSEPQEADEQSKNFAAASRLYWQQHSLSLVTALQGNTSVWWPYESEVPRALPELYPQRDVREYFG